MTKQELLQTAKPILFNTEMVRAILDGRKTVTRRVIKPQPKRAHTLLEVNDVNAIFLCGDIQNGICTDWEEPIKLKYQDGDILYVRETWCHGSETTDILYNNNIKADGYYYRASENFLEKTIWHPSIHMPKEAARIFLKITDIRVEKLSKITEEGIIKEGISVDKNDCVSWYDYISEVFFEFSRIWNNTIKKQDLNTYGFNANPWVWVIEFERVNVDE